MNDRIIVDSIRQGGKNLEKAMRFLYEDPTLRQRVIRFVQSRNGSLEDAEDIFQDGIRNLMLAIRAGKYRSEGSIKGYLFGTCKNLWFRRFSHISRFVDPEQNSMVEEGGTESPEILLLDREREALLGALMDQLGNRCRQVLEMWSQNYAMREIAERLEYKSEGMARKKKHQCLKKLISLIESDEGIKNFLKEAFLQGED